MWNSRKWEPRRWLRPSLADGLWESRMWEMWMMAVRVWAENLLMSLNALWKLHALCTNTFCVKKIIRWTLSRLGLKTPDEPLSPQHIGTHQSRCNTPSTCMHKGRFAPQCCSINNKLTRSHDLRNSVCWTNYESFRLRQRQMVPLTWRQCNERRAWSNLALEEEVEHCIRQIAWVEY